MQQESEIVLWIMWSTVCHLATKHDAQGYLPCMLSVGPRVKVFPSRSFLLYFMVVAFLSSSSWVLLQFDNLFLNHQQRLIYPLLVGGCYSLFLCCTELTTSCSSVSLEVKRRRGDLGIYTVSLLQCARWWWGLWDGFLHDSSPIVICFR